MKKQIKGSMAKGCLLYTSQEVLAGVCLTIIRTRILVAVTGSVTMA